MKKNVLILSASPRRGGNSDLLCDEFLRGAQDAGNAAEKIFLCDRNIHYCTGCGVCNDTQVCVQKDDMADEKGILYTTGVWKAAEVKATPARKDAYEMGKSV